MPAGGAFVFGEALIDIAVSDGTVSEYCGGSPANVALGIARLGSRARFLTAIGADARGQRIAAHLADSGVELAPESFSAERTATATAILGVDGSATYEFDIAWNPVGDDAMQLWAHAAERPALLHTGSIAAFLAPGASVASDLLRAARSQNTMTTFDPNIRPALIGAPDAARERFELLIGAVDVIKMSDEDAEWLYPGVEPDRLARDLLDGGTELVAITLGGRGALLASAGGVLEVPAPQVAVADTIGAGDSFMAALAVALLARGSVEALGSAELERIGLYATRAAAITVTRPGADPPWQRELRPESEEALNGQSNSAGLNR
ncbi:carbohydrate kinase family protein [Leifsonia sp. 2MCAF36]|uniref:carbohydrate kinase family protein n=1 Tax=Leifsonia sp. 2MCAF36 TaxID=3232988 RepID=UPI003F96A205